MRAGNVSAGQSATGLRDSFLTLIKDSRIVVCSLLLLLSHAALIYFHNYTKQLPPPTPTPRKKKLYITQF
jgi:hypothetical protein